jgi:hypothetical protein
MGRNRRRVTRVAAAIALTAAVFGCAAAPVGASPAPIKHVFIIVLENKNFAESFGSDTQAPYLAQTLPSQGALLPNYYGTAHDSLANYIAMVSGQGPNPQTQADCQSYDQFLPGTPTEDGQYLGQGCVLPPGVASIANQLEGAGFTWSAYQEEMNAGAPPGAERPCRHPAIGANDSGSGSFTDGYVTKHNPFMYFHSIIDFPTCVQNDVDLSHLPTDLQSKHTTANYSFISPTMCSDGHNEPCRDGRPGGLEQADQFLRDWVPMILASPGYQDHGLLIVTFDEAHSADDCFNSPCPTGSDPSACCGEKPGPNTPNNAGIEAGLGGGRVGAVLLSPCITPGTVDETPYNHYSMLRSIEDLFGLDHLGFAGQDGLVTFSEGNVFASGPCVSIDLTRKPRKAEVGKKTRFRFQVTSVADECVHGVEIRFAGKRAFTDDAGRAKIRTTLKSERRYRVRATKGGCDPDSARIKAHD